MKAQHKFLEALTTTLKDKERFKKCKHKFKIFESKSWFCHAVFLYCEKCGSYKELI